MDNELNDYEKALLLQRYQDAGKNKTATFDECCEMWKRGIHPVSDTMREMAESVSGQSRYDGGNLEAIVVIEALGLLLASRGVDPKKIYALQQVVRYIWRLGAKDAMDTELGKAENYIHRARTGEWLEK